MRKHHRASIRFSPQQLDEVRQRAQGAGLSLSAYIRQTSLAVVPKKERQLPDDILPEIKRVGNRINRITRNVNSGTPVAASEIREALAELHTVLARIRENL